MRLIPVGLAPPPGVGCGSMPGDDIQDIASATGSSESVLTTITMEATDSGGPPQQTIAREPVVSLAGGDRWMYPSQIANQDAPTYQEEFG